MRDNAPKTEVLLIPLPANDASYLKKLQEKIQADPELAAHYAVLFQAAENQSVDETVLNLKKALFEKNQCAKERTRLVEKMITHIACKDQVTGLYNCRYFKKKLKQLIQKAQKHSTTLTLFFIDLDHFKKINDTFGHERGNEVLAHAAGIIKNVVRESDLAFRYGGDEFVLLCENCDAQNAERIRMRLKTRLSFSEYRLSASVGVSFFPNDALDAETLLKQADERMYESKRSQLVAI